MKKLYSFVILLLIAAMIIGVAAVKFNDVADGVYYAEAAERMSERGILSGYGDGNFHGDESVTRAQIAALVYKMLGEGDLKKYSGKSDFTDVSESAWYAPYVAYAVENKIIVGDGDGRFRPDDYVKYEEVIKVIVCVLGLDKGVKIDKNDWSKEYIEAAEKAGLTDELIGKKGTPMLRSDIAVICDAAMAVLDKVPSGGISGSANKPKPTVPEETTAVTTERDENELPIVPIG